MKAAVYHGQEDIRLEERPIPQIGEREILVQMKACGLCGSDLMAWYLKSRAPLILGHEPCGTVAEIGKNVEDFNREDKVFVHHHVACLTCNYCIHGDYTLCEEFHKTSIDPGGFAEYFRVPTPNLRKDTLKIPEQLSSEEATLIEPVGCCIRALRKCNVQPGDTVAIIGAGTTGIVHTALSRVFGAAKTIVSDIVEFRLKMAERYGADETVNPRDEDMTSVVKAETDGIGADIVIVTAPNTEAIKSGLEACRKGGKLCLFAPTGPGEYIKISPKELFFSETQIIPSYSTSHVETRAALALIESGSIEVSDLITHRFSLADTAKAFKAARENKQSLKVVVFSGSSR